MTKNLSQLYVLAAFIAIAGCSQPKETKTETPPAATVEEAANTLTEAEKAEGWRLLFNGTSVDGWHRYGGDAVGKKWQIQDGTLFFEGKVEGEDETAAAEGGDILTNDEFENYELSLEWKISPGGNSGIIYNVIESDQYEYPWQTGPEMQVLDNDAHKDASIEKHRAGDLYDLIACSEITVKPANQWNEIRLVVNQGNVQHWMNGTKVVETQMWTPEWDELVAGSKFKDMPGFGTGRKGRIALQDHTDPVWYRNIKIREL